MEYLGEVLDTDGNQVRCLIDHGQLSHAREQAPTDAVSSFSIGSIVKITVGTRLIFGFISELVTSPQGPQVLHATVELLGEGAAGPDGIAADFTRGINAYPHPGDRITFAIEQDLERLFSPEGEPHVHIGTVFPSSGVPAPVLFDRLLGRHFAIVGSSGAGKSTLTAMLLNRIVERSDQAHVVILDPHGEYANAFGRAAKVWSVDNLELPYWMMNLEEHCEALLPPGGEDSATDISIMAKCLLTARSRNIDIPQGTKLTADSPIAYRVEDLLEVLEEEAGKLEKLADTSRYTRIRIGIEQAFSDPRFRFIFDRRYASARLEKTIADVMRLPNEGKPVSILDLTGVPTEIINVVVSSIARMVLDFAIWAPRESRPPVLFVCEEAHRYLPRVVTPATRSVVRQLERIAREGRKYGVCLGMVSQRPSELSSTALSQCGTMISLRLNNLQDQEALKAAIPEGARAYVDAIASLRNRECIMSGEGVPVTLRVMIDNADRAHRPSSDDPLFSEGWSRPIEAETLVSEGIRRWRGAN